MRDSNCNDVSGVGNVALGISGKSLSGVGNVAVG